MIAAVQISSALRSSESAGGGGSGEERILDLSASKGSTDGTVDLSWTAPDNGSGGAVDSYEVRYSIAPILTDTDHDNATDFVDGLTPKAPNQSETLTVTGLTNGQNYYFSVRGVVSAVQQAFVYATSAQAAGEDLPDSTSWTEISSLPTTISTAGDYKLADGTYSTTGTAITISAASGTVRFDGRDQAITFNTGDASNARGVDVTGTPGTLELYRVNAAEDATVAGTSTDCHGIFSTGDANVKIMYCTLVTRSRDSYPISLVDVSTLYEISHNTVTSHGDTSSRSDPGAHGIHVLGPNVAGSIHQNTITKTQQWGIWIHGGEAATGTQTLIHHNSFTSTASAWANCYAIGIHWPECYVFENYVVGDHRGIHLELAGTVGGQDAFVRFNRVWVQQNSTVAATTETSHQMKIEDVDNPTIEYNWFHGQGDATHHTPQGLVVDTGSGTQGSEGVVSRYNLYECLDDGNSPGDDANVERCYGLFYLGGRQAAAPDYTIEYDVYKATDRMVFHDWNSRFVGPLQNCAFLRHGAEAFDFERFALSSAAGNDADIDILNAWTPGGVDTTDVTNNGTTSNWTSDRQWTFTVKVVDAAGDPVESATVTVDNATAVQQFTGSTDANGLISGTVTSHNITDAGTTNNNDMDVTVSKAGFTTYNAAHTVSARDGIKVTLNATPTASTAADDTTAPTDGEKEVASALSAGTIYLQWTAATDADGQVAFYAIYEGSDLRWITPNTFFYCSGLLANTSYTFTVKAVGSGNNVSTGINMGAVSTKVEQRGDV